MDGAVRMPHALSRKSADRRDFREWKRAERHAVGTSALALREGRTATRTPF
jgi:hypothetical protein